VNLLLFKKIVWDEGGLRGGGNWTNFRGSGKIFPKFVNKRHSGLLAFMLDGILDHLLIS
jgi:hypothetical protein